MAFESKWELKCTIARLEEFLRRTEKELDAYKTDVYMLNRELKEALDENEALKEAAKTSGTTTINYNIY